MKPQTWCVIGASSAIAEAFARLAAEQGHPLLLVGRDQEQMAIIAADIGLRYHTPCETLICDLSGDISVLLERLRAGDDMALFIAASHTTENAGLNVDEIERLLRVNAVSLCQIIHTYLQTRQTRHRLIFTSSVAACRGRAKNSLYGGSKALVERYLEGLQQADSTDLITIVRLGFIDTVQTFGSTGIFYAASPKACAMACWQASQRGRRCLYYPFFWRGIMAILTRLPFFLYRRVKA